MKQRPKIAILIPRFGLVNRGTESFTRGFISHLGDDFELIVFCRSKREPHTIYVPALSAQNIWVQKVYAFFPTLIKKYIDLFHLGPDEIEMLSFSVMVLPHLVWGNFDILFPQNGIWGAVVCRIIRRLRHIPFIYRSAGGIEPLIARQYPDMYFTINPGIEKWYRTHFPKLNVKFLCNGVDTKKFSPRGKKIIIPLPHPIVMTSGALIEQKRIDLTIRAVAQLKKVSLVIIGDGPLKTHLQSLAHKELGPKRFLMVHLPHNAIEYYYRSCDAFAFAAPTELGWGMVHLEAMASNMRVIANNEENIAFLTQGKAFLCDVSDVNNYAKAIAKALRTKKIESRKAILPYSWEKIASHYKKDIHAILESYRK